MSKYWFFSQFMIQFYRMRKENIMTRVTKKMRRKYNIFFNIVAFISLTLGLIFAILIYAIGMIPNKYITIIWIVLGVIYLVLLALTLPRKLKIKVKSVSCVMFIIFAVLFSFGIWYVNKTYNFLDLINNKLMQKEDYYLMTIDKDISVDSLKGKAVGLYAANNKDEVISKAKKTYEFTIKEYSDVVAMFEDLSDKKIAAVLINDSAKSLLSSDLSYMNLKLNEISSIQVPVKDSDTLKVVDVTNTPFNVYIAGGDAYGSINKVTNTDVNMVVSVDPVNKKLLLTSIPRDYYVNLPTKGENAYDKLTHAGYYGIDSSIKAVEKLLDTDINYYVKVNFSTIKDVIDAIGGVDVYSNYAFTEDSSMKHFHYVKGWNHLNGERALAFARERHAFADGDVQRVKNQQKVLTAIINKVTKSTTLITNYGKILDSASKSISMNMDTKSISRLVKLQLNDMSPWTIESQNLVGSDLYTKGTWTFPNLKLYVMKQNDESVKMSQDKLKNFIGR